ncbi:hypothetical protein EK904_002713 [Melospiza melodia maxima]|nr:hypothetical protein EK904_002713 [Melospiza melodia maxima]
MDVQGQLDVSQAGKQGLHVLSLSQLCFGESADPHLQLQGTPVHQHQHKCVSSLTSSEPALMWDLKDAGEHSSGPCPALCMSCVHVGREAQLGLGMELSLELFDASSVSQGTGYTFSQRSWVVNCDFFSAIFLLLLLLGKPEPSIKHLQQEQ